MDTRQRENQQKTVIAEGFQFFSSKDAELAASERKKVDYLEARMDYSHPESILKLYCRALEERVFKTPVGINFLKKLQDFLLHDAQIEPGSVPPIPLYQYYDSEIRPQATPARKRVNPPVKKEKKSSVLPVSILLNLMLVAAIIAMFIISFNADQPNIFNYERALQDKYSSWESQLLERERIVREKELELHIQHD